MKSKAIARKSRDGRTQCLMKHLSNVACRAKKCSRNMQWVNLAYAAGLLHDVGKYDKKFQEYIKEADENSKNRGKIDHSSAGARESVSIFSKEIGKIIAYAIAGHHAGLPDGAKKDESDRASLEWRLKKKKIGDYSAYEKEIEKPPEIKPEECSWLIRKKEGNDEIDRKRTAFAISFFIRMLFSCLVDADRLDAEWFEFPQKKDLRENYPSLMQLKQRLDDYLLRKCENSSDIPINIKRKEILEDCRAAAQESPGLFSLTVPTGGGKTLSSLAFALEHAIKHNLERVIYVIPFTSIIEQNADVFRDALGDLKYAVVEHHSNFDSENYNQEELEKHDLAVENWDAPIIVTTNVQFFESLFSHRPSQCRKLHNIMNSVVILDEVQTLPVNLLQPCIEALRELAEHYNTSIVLCTATQPALQKPDLSTGLENVREIVKNREALYDDNVFKRVDVEFLGKLSNDELADRIKREQKVLCIVNTRKHARTLYELVKDEPNTFYLSALMCPQHRSNTIDEIRAKLNSGEVCKVISTQLIEAGVDIDFPVVYRAISGIDSIAQAAGRCNREGKLIDANGNEKKGKVYVFETEEKPPGYIRQSADKGLETIRECERKNWDMLSLEAIRYYFKFYYWSQSDAEGSGLDRKKILEKLAKQLNKLNFPFRDITASFHLIDEKGYLPVIIQFDDKCKALVKELREPDFSDWKLLRKLQRYIVSIPKWEHDAIRHNLELLHKQYFILINDSLYDEKLGLCTDDPTYIKTETTVC